MLGHCLKLSTIEKCIGARLPLAFDAACPNHKYNNAIEYHTKSPWQICRLEPKTRTKSTALSEHLTCLTELATIMLTLLTSLTQLRIQVITPLSQLPT